jgi:hypothetical protein
VGPTGWLTQPTLVTLSATDNSGAVAAINYAVTGMYSFSASAPPGPDGKATFTLNQEGGSDIAYWAQDAVPNTEATHVIRLQMDTVAPTVTLAGIVPPPSSAGWINRYPTLKFLASDAGSGVASVTSEIAVTTDGSRVVTGRASDVAGNVTTLDVPVNVDTKPPVVSCTPDRTPNATGWCTILTTVVPHDMSAK